MQVASVFLEDRVERKSFPNTEVLVVMAGVGKAMCVQRENPRFLLFGHFVD